MVEVDPFKIGETVGRLTVGAQNERRAEKAALRESASGSADMQLAAQAHAKRLAVREQFLLNLWRPLAKWAGVSREYFENQFPTDLAAKLEHVPDQDLQSPKPAIAAPAMEALGYSLDEPALKEMYLNLLAGASMKSQSDRVHPSFVDVVRQLSADEAMLLNTVLRIGTWSMAQVRRVFAIDNSYNIVIPYLLPLVHVETGEPIVFDRLAVWVENWERLGLVQSTVAEHRVSHPPGVDLYDWVEARPEYQLQRAAAPVAPEGEQAEWRIGFEKGLLRATDRGVVFREIVSAEGQSVPASDASERPLA